MEQHELSQNLTTLRDYIRWGTSEFNRQKLTFGHGFGSALDETVYLVLHALSLPWNFPESYFDTTLTDIEREQVHSLLLERVSTRKPAAYLTNEAWFCGLPFYVDERVLVPRSPIAELINNHFEPWLDSTQVENVLDLCTGSGCIAIACQYAFPDATVSASDLSSDAIEVAKKNRKKHDLVHRLNLYESDLFEQIPVQKFDLIVSNPPYVDAEDMADLSDEFMAEPEMGLAAGPDGLDIVDRMLIQAVDYLTDNGLLVVEVGNSQAAMMGKYNDLPLSWIEFENGGGGVFCITATELKQHHILNK
ncbi:MAG: 50S ribosomal protein L3 N(5)-glutamine methyltransferase [Gammaproteobacteria bacterium]|nr:50S ribosomal protein L3 N(5)-glutamine methyltransferase [Gammaproteobacteria bacterium]